MIGIFNIPQSCSCFQSLIYPHYALKCKTLNKPTKDPDSHVRLHYNTFSLGGTPGNSCCECATPFFQILTLCYTKKGNFPHPFLNLASKIHTCFQTWPLRNYVSINKTYTPVVPLNTLPDGQSQYLFLDWNGAKTIPFGWHIPIWLILGSTPRKFSRSKKITI